MPIDYQKAKIYRIVNDTIPDMVYYGSTCQNLSTRMAGHRCYAKRININNSSKQLFQTGNPVIVLVENFPCKSKEELLMRERFYIENNSCVNKQVPGRSDAEYREDHKEKISKWKKEIINCECGTITQKGHLSRHKKSAKHIKFMNEHYLLSYKSYIN